MTYARARLWLGITSVGSIVVLTALALGLGAPRALVSLHPEAWGVAAALTGACLLLLLPFDILGGFVLPREYGRSREGFPVFTLRWLRGALVHAGVLLAGLFLLHLGGLMGGVPGSVLAALVATELLLRNQLLLARLVGGLQPVSHSLDSGRSRLARWGLRLDRPVTVVRAGDHSFVGGWVGGAGAERLVVPELWITQLPEEMLGVQLARRLGVLVNGSRSRGIHLARAWVVGGWALCLLATGGRPETLSGLLTAWLAFQLWSFLGLLLLPTPSRLGVFEADDFAVAHGIDRTDLVMTAEALDPLQEDEPRRAAHVETIFHPVPSVANRRARMEVPRSSPLGAWQVARQTLFLSWAVGGLLSRAVHCNLGRPELWVLLPGD